MSDLSEKAKPAVETLLNADEDQLYAQLGIRAKAMAADPSLSASFAPAVSYDAPQMGVMDDVKDFGRRLFRRWNGEAYNLVCGTDPKDGKDRAELMKAAGMSDVAFGALLSGFLVSIFGIAPAIAPVIAALVVKRFFRPAAEELCHVWKQELSKE